jgi:2-iminobutanoate/2-iminopropanoate deaminase
MQAEHDLAIRTIPTEESMVVRNVVMGLAAAGALVLAAPGELGAQGSGGKKVISSPDAPEAIGPYSQAIAVGNTLYLAGQIPIDPRTKELKLGSIEEQTRLVLDNLKAVLAANGMTMDNVVSTQVFMKDLNDFAKMNAVYGEYFRSAPPARATVQVARLPRDVAIEIAAIAVR